MFGGQTSMNVWKLVEVELVWCSVFIDVFGDGLRLNWVPMVITRRPTCKGSKIQRATPWGKTKGPRGSPKGCQESYCSGQDILVAARITAGSKISKNVIVWCGLSWTILSWNLPEPRFKN